MIKKFILLILVQFVVCVFSPGCWAGDAVFSITGLVKHPLNLHAGDLNKFQTVSVRINNIDQAGRYQGVFNTQGVPLKNLLEVCGLQKEDSGFSKPVDLAIVVRDAAGKQVVLSWGEVFYKNPANVSIAFSSAPVVPHWGASKPNADQLNRKISFPKLVVASDHYSDRSLEGVVNIEVVNVKTRGSFKKIEGLFSSDFNVTGAVKKTLAISDLSSYPRTEISAAIIAENRGYEGIENYGGVSLVELLTKAGVEPDLSSVFFVTAPDGYRSLISYGELFLSPLGKRIVVADREQGKPLKKNGKFILVLPDDLFADREVKAVAKIEAISLRSNPKLYIIGVGPGDTNFITPEAISYLGKTDALVCPEDIGRRFDKYLAGKKVLFSPMKIMHKHHFMKVNPGLPPGELDKALYNERIKAVQKIKDVFAEGKSVAFLDWGDPLIFGSSRWIRGFFAEGEIETIPSISAFNVSNAVIDKDITCKGSVVLTAPQGLKTNEALMKAAAENGDTLAVFMGLRELKGLMPLLNKYYKETTPIAIVYNAGISSAEHLVRSTLKDILSKTEREQEKHLGMIYIGPCLEINSTECN